MGLEGWQGGGEVLLYWGKDFICTRTQHTHTHTHTHTSWLQESRKLQEWNRITGKQQTWPPHGEWWDLEDALDFMLEVLRKGISF